MRPALEEVALPAARPVPKAIVDAVGPDAVLSGAEERLRRAAGRGYPDLVRLRSGRLDEAPDAVVLPGSAAEVARVLEACARERVAVVPFGGGTSVVGGVDPAAPGFDCLISLDLGRMVEVSVDRRSLTATLGPGLRGPDAELALAERGVTLGHYPQSFEYATIGGFAATRSAGQASSGYGRFDALVTSIALTAPVGEIRTLETPHTAAGPALRELVVGSEGALGVITEVTARVRPVPEHRRYEAWMAADFEAGTEIVRSLAQADALPDVVRVSDQAETRISLALAGTAGAKRALMDGYLKLRRRAGGCVVICGWEGEREAVERRRALAARRLRSGGGASLGSAPGRAWERGRYNGPYLRDELLDLGYMAETLETAHTWSGLDGLYEAVTTAIADVAPRPGDTRGGDVPPLARLSRRGISLLHLPGSSKAGRRARAVASRQVRRLRGDRGGRGNDHPPPRGRPRPPAVHERRDRRARDRNASRGQGPT